MSIHEVIARHQLEPADAVELVCPEIGFPKHYAIYAGTENGHPLFIANMLGGIQVIRKERLQGFLVKYVITNVERFSGRTSQRFRVIRDALKRVSITAMMGQSKRSIPGQ